MIKEFVPYEQALALKELGFDEPCLGYYENGVFIFWYDSIQDNELILNCSAPLYQQAFKWFREKHYICGWVQESYFLSKKLYQYTISRVETLNIIGDITEIYEEAEFACLIKLIEIVKNK